MWRRGWWWWYWACARKLKSIQMDAFNKIDLLLRKILFSPSLEGIRRGLNCIKHFVIISFLSLPSASKFTLNFQTFKMSFYNRISFQIPQTIFYWTGAKSPDNSNTSTESFNGAATILSGSIYWHFLCNCSWGRYSNIYYLVWNISYTLYCIYYIYIAFLTMIYNRYLMDILHLHRWIEYVEITICISHCIVTVNHKSISNVWKLENQNV